MLTLHRILSYPDSPTHSCTTEMLWMRGPVPGVAPSRSLRTRRPPKASNSVGLCSVQYSATHRAACDTASARAFATIVHD